jgi:hypothetical protein
VTSSADLPPWLVAMLYVLADRLAPMLASELTRAPERNLYTSEDLPRDCRTRRTFAEQCKRIPEAAKRGRTWAVPRAAWDEHRTRRRGNARPVEASAPTTASLDTRATALLRAAGLRVVR